MSIWTHVTGSFTTIDNAKTIKAALGEPFLYRIAREIDNKYGYDSPESEEYNKKWMDAFNNEQKGGIPMGSEGSLDYRIIKDRNFNPDEVTVIVQGNLRDYEEPGPIIKWIKGFSKQLPWVDGVFKIWSELHNRITIVFVEDNKVKIIHTSKKK